MTAPTWVSLSIDTQIALRTAAARLTEVPQYLRSGDDRTVSSWDDLDDPAGLDPAAVRPIRDDIERRVPELIAQPGIHSATERHQPVP